MKPLREYLEEGVQDLTKHANDADFSPIQKASLLTAAVVLKMATMLSYPHGDVRRNAEIAIRFLHEKATLAESIDPGTPPAEGALVARGTGSLVRLTITALCQEYELQDPSTGD